MFFQVGGLGGFLEWELWNDWLDHHNIGAFRVSSFKLTPNAPVQEKHDSLGWDDQESLLV